MPIEAREAEVLAWLDTQYEAMVELLAQLVNTDSGSFDKAGVDRTGEILREHLEGRGIACEVTDHPTAGFFLKATVPSRNGQSNDHVLLMGHRDTVFGKGDAKERPFRIEGHIGYGPGVSDMKSGLVREVLPDAQQRLLRGVLGEVEITQDPARHGEEPIRDAGGKVGVGLLVSSLSPEHEFGIHRLFRMSGIGSDRRLHPVWA
jgi:glutamate carboxypeptidase